MSCCSERRLGGQATIEAAFLLPSVLLTMAVLIQPGIILFDRTVMGVAAAEGIRMLETLAPGDERAAREAVERRLSSIPDVGLFHEGAWSVEVSGGEGQPEAVVSIEHALRPLPLAGAVMGVFGLADADGLFWQGVRMDAETTESWVAESRLGRDAAAWMGRWEEKA